MVASRRRVYNAAKASDGNDKTSGAYLRRSLQTRFAAWNLLRQNARILLYIIILFICKDGIGPRDTCCSDISPARTLAKFPRFSLRSQSIFRGRFARVSPTNIPRAESKKRLGRGPRKRCEKSKFWPDVPAMTIPVQDFVLCLYTVFIRRGYFTLRLYTG